MNNATTLLVQEEPRGPSQLIEVLIPAQLTSNVTLPVIQNLQNDVNQIVILKALRVIPDTVLSRGPLQGFVNAPLTELIKISLVLYSQDWLKGQLIPLLTLVDTFTEGSGIPWRNRTARFNDWQNVDWGKSFLQYSNGTQSIGTAYEVIFEAEYQKFKKDAVGNLVEIQGMS